MSVLTRLLYYRPVIIGVCIPSLAAITLLLLRMVLTGDQEFWYMAWNLTLSIAAVLAGAACLHYWRLRHSVSAAGFFLVWLFLLPNTFYMLTDYIHVGQSGDINILFDIVMVGLFAMNGFFQGIVSLYFIHKKFIERFGAMNAHVAVAIIILASSFAVDMGRYLRLNSWDVLLNPRTLIFDLSDTFLNPGNYDRSFLVTAIFFIAIGSLYIGVWQCAGWLQKPRSIRDFKK